MLIGISKCRTIFTIVETSLVEVGITITSGTMLLQSPLCTTRALLNSLDVFVITFESVESLMRCDSSLILVSIRPFEFKLGVMIFVEHRSNEIRWRLIDVLFDMRTKRNNFPHILNKVARFN